MKEGEQIYGFVVRLLTSPDPTWTVQDVMDKFYGSDYFKGTGAKPVRRIGF